MPPTAAMAMAMLASVTVSIGEETRGVRSLMLRVMWDEMSTWWAPKLMWPGKKMTSS